MKYKIIYPIIFLCSITFVSMAQIKIHDDNHISLGSLSKSFGLQIHPSGHTYFQPSIYEEYAWMNTTICPNIHSKAYIVDYKTKHTFFVYGNGQIYSGGIWIESDSCLKKDVVTIEDALNKVRNLRGITYRYKDSVPEEDTATYTDKYGHVYDRIHHHSFPDSSNGFINPDVRNQLIEEYERKYLGLIAQEVERVVPEAVRTMPDGTKTLSYANMIGLLVEAIKEQQIQIDSITSVLVRCCGRNDEGGAQLNNSSGNINSDILFQNKPNPFTEKTTIQYAVTTESYNISILIFNLQGNLIKTFSNLDAGKSEIVISGRDLKPGMYVYSLIVNGEEKDSKRMILTQ
ncbi:MAG: T9SS type A sorting domain-containing protein [Bacteroidetes bacterium]|nr:T9SS type A sorting domain-containing protein [Bacteroidota bacterium]